MYIEIFFKSVKETKKRERTLVRNTHQLLKKVLFFKKNLHYFTFTLTNLT